MAPDDDGDRAAIFLKKFIYSKFVKFDVSLNLNLDWWEIREASHAGGGWRR